MAIPSWWCYWAVAPASSRLLLLLLVPGATFASTSDSRRIRTSSAPSLVSVPPYLEKTISSPSATSISMRFPSLSRAPGPTDSTWPRCGFSLAVSGRTIPLTVNSSSSRTSTINRSPSGCRFMKASLKSLSRNGFCAELSRGPRTAPPDSNIARALRERGNPVRDCPAAGLAGDHRACCDLRGVRECVFELLLPHPLCGQPRRLVRLRRALEQPDRGQHPPTGVDQVVAAEPRQLAEPRQQAVANLSRHFLGAHLVDPLVAAHSRIHVIASISLDSPTATPETGPPHALKPCV